MKKLTDSEIQELLDKGELPGGAGAELYKKVFNTLAEEPDYRLSANFANAVVNKVATKTSLVEKLLYFLCGLAALSTLILAVVLINIFASPSMITYLPYMGIGFVMIGLIQWLDKYSRRVYV